MAERAVAEGLVVVFRRRIVVEVKRRRVFRALHVVVPLVAEADVGACPVVQLERPTEHGGEHGCLSRRIPVERQEVAEAVLRHVQRVGSLKRDQVEEVRVVADIHQDVGELLCVVREVQARREGVRTGLLPDL